MSQIRTAIYARLSQYGAGVDRQLADCEALAVSRGWNVTHRFVDNDVSAARKAGKIASRPQFDAMCEAIEAGEVDGVVGWDTDRLFRDLLDQEQFFLLAERCHLVRIATPHDVLDVSSGEGLVIWRIKTAMAAEEVRKTSKRWKNLHLHRARNGLPTGGIRPFGFESDRVTVREPEAAMIRAGVAHLLAGGSFTSIVTSWNASDVPPVKGTMWRHSSIHGILTSPRIAGLRTHLGDTYPAVWPAIVDEADWRQVVALFASRRKKPHPRANFLAGLIVCGECGAKLKSHGNGQYACLTVVGGCNRNAIRTHLIESYIAARILAVLGDPMILRSLDAYRTEHAPSELVMSRDSLQAQLDELTDRYFDGQMNTATFDRNRIKLVERLDKATSDLAKYDAEPLPFSPDIVALDLRSWWESLDVSRKHKLASWFVTSITLRRATVFGGKFDPDRVHVEPSPQAERLLRLLRQAECREGT